MKNSFLSRKLNTAFEHYGQRSVVGLLCMFIFLSFNATAAVISVDDTGGFGIDVLTRDTDQGLDFLDLTLSQGRSFNDVSGEFGIGGDFEGFRYATIDEFIQLANNFGVNPPFVPGNAANIDTDIAELVDFLGVTGSIGPFNRTTWAITSSISPTNPPGRRRIVEFIDEFDSITFQDRISSEVGLAIDVSTVSLNIGSALVRSQPIPEPGTLLLILLGVGSFIGLRQHRKRID